MTFLQRAPGWSFVGRRVADARADVPDKRDQLYVPTLKPLPSRLLPFADNAPWWSSDRVRNQGARPSCVGHALAAIIDHMRAVSLQGTATPETKKTLAGSYVSAEMLYFMARYHDEIEGEDYAGSSIRGGLKGFFYNGVCSEHQGRARPEPNVRNLQAHERSEWFMTKTLAEEAHAIQLGAYYRIRPRVSDMHAALCEADAVIVSASTHSGWERPTPAVPEIEFVERARPDVHRRHAMHAFAIIGYDERGFWVQNSWGKSWGSGGLARWLYEDWAANVVDAWVLRLAVLPPPGKHVLAPGSRRLMAYGSRIDKAETHFIGRAPVDSSGPSRLDVLGHLVPFRDGRLDHYGPYNVNRQTLGETFKLIKQRYGDMRVPADGDPFAADNVVLPLADRKYRHVLIYFLGGWPDENRLAADIADVIPGFKKLGIYPFFVSFDTPVFKELNSIIRRAIDEIAERAVNTPVSRRLVRDRRIEGHIALAGNRLLRDLRHSARRVFRLDQPDPDYAADPLKCGEGGYCLARLFEDLKPLYRDRSLDFHVAAHGFGAQLLVECLAQQKYMETRAGFTTCTLISPLVATHRIGHLGDVPDSFYSSLLPRGERASRRHAADLITIEQLRLITLDEQSMRTDRFSDDYGRSWPELWSYVMGLDPMAIQQNASVPGDATAQEARLSGRHVPLLAMPHQVRLFAKAARQDSLDVSLIEVVSKEDDIDSSLHHELGFHRVILDAVAGVILGKTAAGSFSGGGREISLREVARGAA